APGYPVVVIDTKGNLSAARNKLAAAIDTEYVFLAEEDMQFTAATAAELPACVEILDDDEQISGVGGICLEAKKGRVRWGHNFDVVGGVVGGKAYVTPSTRPMRTTPTGRNYRPCDLVLNMGLFRRELWRRVPWDARLPVTEHREYFYRASL